MKKLIHKILAIFIAILSVCISVADFSATGISASADNVAVNDYSKTDISNDLSDLDILLYPKNPYGVAEIIRFQEYCFSEKAFFKEAYGVYFYVYNPTEKEIVESTAVVNMAVSYDTDGNPSGYKNLPLLVCDKTENNRFYKFKVNASTYILSNASTYAKAHGGERRYDITGIQLAHKDGSSSSLSTNDSKYARTYYVSGYTKGCSVDATEESTLTVRYETLDTISLDVHATTFRPEGNNGKNEYTQDSLHSVWFSIPNEFIEKYDELTSVHATWLNAVLNPMLVTGNQHAYNSILPYLGKNIGKETNDFNYSYLGAYSKELNSITGAMHTVTRSGFSYNIDYNPTYKEYGYAIETLYLMFYAGSGDNSADNYIPTPEEIKEKMRDRSEIYGGEQIIGAEGIYSKCLFESIDEKYTDLRIYNTDEFKLENTIINRNWWEILWGLKGEDIGKDFDDIKAIEPISDSVLEFTDDVISKELLISKNDVSTFRKSLKDAKANNETVYVFRYMVSDYVSQEATLLEKTSILGVNSLKEIDSNAYFFQETINLNFDIIDVGFGDEGNEVIVPVVANPTDNVGEGTPPINTTPDFSYRSWLEKIQARISSFLASLKGTMALIGRYALIGISGVVLGVIFIPLLIKGIRKFLDWLFFGKKPKDDSDTVKVKVKIKKKGKDKAKDKHYG